MQSVDALSAPVEPVDALLRIAFLLERAREGSYRVEAFRKAATVAAALGPEQVRSRVTAGTIGAVSSIGKTTATVITEAVRGELPTYLAALQAAHAPLTSDGTELYAALVGDLHTHSNWSDGGAPIEEMVTAAVALDHRWMALTDHSPALRVANGLTAERLARQLDVIETINTDRTDGFRLLAGVEVDILDGGALDQTEEMLGRLDIVTASVHSNLRMGSLPMTKRIIAAIAHPEINVLGHCTGQRVDGNRTRPPSTFNAVAVFTACLETGTAVEINSRPERVDPPDPLIEIARDLGCLFAIDSDAHAPGQLDFKALGCERAQRLGIPAERIVTTWPLDRLLEWANA